MAPEGEPTRAKVHDFVDKELGRAVPYGVYDLANDEGWVSVGDTADTAALRRRVHPPLVDRWERPLPRGHRLLITADAGGSNGYRVKLWKVELAKLAARDRPGDHRLPLPAGNVQVEPDRAPHVQLHLHELARTAPRVLPDHHRADLDHHHAKGLTIRAEET